MQKMEAAYRDLAAVLTPSSRVGHAPRQSLQRHKPEKNYIYIKRCGYSFDAEHDEWILDYRTYETHIGSFSTKRKQVFQIDITINARWQWSNETQSNSYDRTYKG